MELYIILKQWRLQGVASDRPNYNLTPMTFSLQFHKCEMRNNIQSWQIALYDILLAIPQSTAQKLENLELSLLETRGGVLILLLL